MDPDNPVFSMTCGSPKRFEGMLVRKVPADQFNCSVTQDCPDSCTCTKTVAIGLISVYCRDQYHADDLPTTCPVADNININIKSDTVTSISSREYLRNVTVFDVSQCAIADIDRSIVDVLEGAKNELIYLQDKFLEIIPKTFQNFNFSEGQILTIDGNHFNCDCHTLWMKQWLLSNKNHIYHQDKILCATGPGKGKPMVEVPDNDFVCQTSLTFLDILFITAGSLLVFVILVSVTLFKINSIQVFMISHFDICKHCFRKRKHRRLRYDIFIPHSCEDDEIIEVVTNYLEHHDPKPILWKRYVVDILGNIDKETVFHRMLKQATMPFFMLVFLFLRTRTTLGYSKLLYKDSSDFSCDFSNSTLKLVIHNGFIEEKVKNCLKTYNTAETLIFSNSRLKAIPEYLNILDRLTHLELPHNEITTVSFNTTEQICKKLKQLVLDNNDINVLRPGNIDCLESLETLSLANNNLLVIVNGTFNVKLKALRNINLANNNLTSVDTSLVSKLLLSKNTNISVNASLNRVTGFTNSINITIEHVSKLTQIYFVLTHNNMTTFNTEYYFKMFNITHPFPQLLNLWNSGFDTRFNPFICDCALFPLASALKKFHKMDPDNPVFSTTCGSPKRFEGMLVRKVPADQFNCSVTQDCPDSCTCTKTVAISLISVDCSDQYHAEDLPTTCPVADNININIKSDDVTSFSSRDYLRNVTVFDVSQCAIADIDPSIVDVLEGSKNELIYLQDNYLETIPETFQNFNFSEGQVLTIDGNPFNCDCHTLWMKQWLLLNKNHIYHQDKILCATGPGKGKPMVEVPDNDFVCQTSLTFLDMLFITVGSLLVFIILVSVTFCKINSIQVFMISHFGICKHCFRRRKHRHLRYDIFIPHSCEDDDIIEAVANYLEHHDPPYKVCIGERNFEPGKTISENILVAIESSHTTLLVISNNFLRSAWCNMEFREAHMRFLRDRNINMVLIILEDLDASLVYKELKLYLETHVYIKYSDKHFWAKLLQCLPIMIPNDPTRDETSPLISG
ncbi:protein toll-like [Mercenaria mercenaria]|uniref:protein toll-like n=1 Tax=Mercenaria mercenaria TaxID=6596 RepID=UPI00234E9DCA|nr:protein toll-like [Mercenaria mercenaria]